MSADELADILRRLGWRCRDGLPWQHPAGCSQLDALRAVYEAGQAVESGEGGKVSEQGMWTLIVLAIAAGAWWVWEVSQDDDG